MSLFAGGDYSTKHALVEYRVKKLSFACIWAIYQNRFALLILFEYIPNLLNIQLYWIWVLVRCNILLDMVFALNSWDMTGIITWFYFNVKSYPVHDFDYYSCMHSIMVTMIAVLSCLKLLLIRDWIMHVVALFEFSFMKKQTKVFSFVVPQI